MHEIFLCVKHSFELTMIRYIKEYFTLCFGWTRFFFFSSVHRKNWLEKICHVHSFASTKHWSALHIYFIFCEKKKRKKKYQKQQQTVTEEETKKNGKYSMSSA